MVRTATNCWMKKQGIIGLVWPFTLLQNIWWQRLPRPMHTLTTATQVLQNKLAVSLGNQVIIKLSGVLVLRQFVCMLNTDKLCDFSCFLIHASRQTFTVCTSFSTTHLFVPDIVNAFIDNFVRQYIIIYPKLFSRVSRVQYAAKLWHPIGVHL